MQHLAVIVSNNVDKHKWLHQLTHGKMKGIPPFFNNGNGLLFSAITLNEFMQAEARFGTSELMPPDRASIRHLSSGEQKKLLLNYLLQQQPDYVILDDPFDNLDLASKKSLALELNMLAEKMAFLQLVDRKEDLFPFMQEIVHLNDNGELVELDKQEPTNQNENNAEISGTRSIPPPQINYELPNEVLVDFNDVSVSYEGRPILKQINWQIKKGEFWQLKGPNGSGKTTLVTMITGDNPKAYGQNITLFGRRKGSGESIWDIREKIGYFTPPMADLFSRYQSVEQMILGGFFDSIGLYRSASEWQVKLAADWMRVIDLYPQRHKAFYTLSLGAQRLVLIARAMVKHPPLLILDEPTAGLDDHNAAILGLLVQKIADEKNTSILFVSHRIETWMRPTSILELIPGADGSTGVVTRMN